MDLLDLLAVVQPPMGGGRRPRTAGEHLAYALGTLVFPVALVLLVLFAGLWAHPVAVLALSVGFVAATALVARSVGVRAGETLAAALGCALACFLFGGIALVLGLFGSFFASF